ncbi:MAG: hypothetical protein J6A75_13265 [Lachnospiraceae bacterium]|nr:hypothetical protein [Lachnospiraceae bacterium]
MKIREFLKGTRDNHIINISEDTNENVVFEGTYAELKTIRKDLLCATVKSWDALPMADGSIEIGIMV